MKINFKPQSNFFRSNDPQDSRLGNLVGIPNDFQEIKNSIAIMGYADDEGIANNGGRMGAALAPEAIRKHFYKMTPPLLKEDFYSNTHGQNIPRIPFYDLGNVSNGDSTHNSIEERHSFALSSCETLLKNKNKIIALGGGHDFAYPNGASFLKTFKDQNPLVINFDAHLDVRPFNGKIHSGTPFYRLLLDFERFDLLEIGIQSQCNSKHHLAWAKSKGAHILTWDEISQTAMRSSLGINTEKIQLGLASYYNEGWLSILKGSNHSKMNRSKEGFKAKDLMRHFFKKSKEDILLNFLKPFITGKNFGRPTFLSVDIDSFSSVYAPGASQVFPTGFAPHDFFFIMNFLKENLDIKIIGIYEVSPPFDHDDRTSKLAAQIAHNFL